MPDIELILCIGAYAQGWHLGAARGPSMTTTVEDWRRFLGSNAGPRIMPLPHPSWRNTGWIRRHPWFEAELLPALQMEVARTLRRP
jgi:uracil-DNA glycosylase